MPFPSPVELIIILVIALLILGPGKLPDVGSALGKSIREFRKAATDVQDATRLDDASIDSAHARRAGSRRGPVGRHERERPTGRHQRAERRAEVLASASRPYGRRRRASPGRRPGPVT